ncbi:cell division protein ZapE [Celerinatantimonas yamalensis]|uniref:Cell division protein ZapE n=1 Tax=Celerinatantimonas yamalensis TaxID=559956 RepID=A0ABW9GAK4_9GAMM
MTPQQRYLNDQQLGHILPDASQQRVVEELERIYRAFDTQVKINPAKRKRLWSFVKTEPKIPIQGLYMWGGVGRGKTYLMDLLVDCLPQKQVMRQHFYHFMQHIHHQLTELQGEVNPLSKIAKQIAEHIRLICFDEFFVTDITDAMLLGTLFEALFAEGVGLVATSNIQPNELYRNGLQRSRFLPAIALIEQHCQVINVDGQTDYRLRKLTPADCYHWPLNGDTMQMLEQTFVDLARSHPQAGHLSICNRSVAYLGCHDGVLFASFAALCQSARSSQDYIEIAHRFHTVIISDVPLLTDADNDSARRLITLVDEFYERHVVLVLNCACEPQRIYQGQRLAFEFERSYSRLHEMQSQEYLELMHLS